MTLEKRQWSKPDKEEISEGELSLYLFYFSGHLQAIGFRRGEFPKGEISYVGQHGYEFWMLICWWKGRYQDPQLRQGKEGPACCQAPLKTELNESHQK